MRRLTGIGECMVEFSQAGAGLYRRAFAGDVANTLYYARRALGSDWAVRFHTGLGTDPESQALADFLQDNGIDTDSALRVPDRRPGLYVIHLNGAERSFSYWRDRSAARLLASDPAALRAGLAGSDMIYLSGITLAILPHLDVAELFHALKEASELGIPIAFDPNIRPALWPDAAQMAETITACAAHASIVLPSFADEAAHFGDATPEATASRYAAAGAGLVVVKDGEKDILVRQDGTVRTFPTAPVADAVDTTGAGDSFNGAFLAALLQGEDLDAAISAAQAMAVHVIRHHGALC